MHGPQDHLT